MPAIGKYQLLGRVAQSVMSEVFVAEYVAIEGFRRRVVLKRISRELSRDREWAAAFVDEAKLTAQFQHPHLVATIDLGSFEDRLYLVSEYVAGGSVRELLRQSPKGFSEAAAFAIAVDVLRGLHAAHTITDERGEPLLVVHRDICPENILLSQRGIVKVVDFGIAHHRARLHTTRRGIIKGRLRYMSPEQMRGESVGARSDLYSCALLLLEMLTGRAVNDHKDEQDLINAVANNSRDGWPERFGLWLPVLSAALDAAPSARPETAMAFADLLEEYALGRFGVQWRSALAELAERSTPPALELGKHESVASDETRPRSIG